MIKIIALPISILLLASFFLTACSTPSPSEGSITIDIQPLQSKQISLNSLKTAFSDNALLPPLYDQPPGTHLYATVIPFNVRSLSQGVSYKNIEVVLNLVKDVGTSDYPENDDAKFITAIPISVERTADETTSSKIAASVSAMISVLTGSVTAEKSKSESYQRIYRTTTANLTPGEIDWEFNPFIDEPIQPGIYYLVAVVEVTDGTSGNLIFASGGCSYSVSKASGLSSENNLCSIGDKQKIELPIN